VSISVKQEAYEALKKIKEEKGLYSVADAIELLLEQSKQLPSKAGSCEDLAYKVAEAVAEIATSLKRRLIYAPIARRFLAGLVLAKEVAADDVKWDLLRHGVYLPHLAERVPEALEVDGKVARLAKPLELLLEVCESFDPECRKAVSEELLK